MVRRNVTHQNSRADNEVCAVRGVTATSSGGRQADPVPTQRARPERQCRARGGAWARTRRRAEIGSAVMDMLGDKALCGASRSFASAVPRFGELAHAEDLIEQAV